MFDSYEIRARIIPAIAVASPIILPMLAFDVNTPDGWVWTTVATAVLVIIVYIFSFIVRRSGKKIEGTLWKNWGGPPSSTVLLHTDTTFPENTKTDIKSTLKELYQVDLDKHEEGTSGWKEKVFEAFRLVRQYLRQHDPKGIWYTHNAEYGLFRNLLGASLLGAIIAGIVTLPCSYAAYQHQKPLEIALCIIAFIYTGVVLYTRKYTLPRLVRENAFQYAESAWLCFLNVTKTGSKG